jgi:hypothetical protein
MSRSGLIDVDDVGPGCPDRFDQSGEASEVALATDSFDGPDLDPGRQSGRQPVRHGS